MAGFEVSIEDIRAYAALVERQHKAAVAMHDYATGNIADADFGRLMDLLSGDYGQLLPQVHSLLAEQGTRLGLESDAFDSAASTYSQMDESAAARYDAQAAPARSTRPMHSGMHRAI